MNSSRFSRVVFLLVSALLFIVSCSDGKPKHEEPVDDDVTEIDFSDVSAESCACEKDCLLADFECKAACDGPQGECRDDCDQVYADCAVACEGCIALYTLCYRLCGDNSACTLLCDEGLPYCQQACGWDHDCLADCNQADEQCYADCGGEWECYTGCLLQTKTCYADCL